MGEYGDELVSLLVCTSWVEIGEDEEEAPQYATEHNHLAVMVDEVGSVESTVTDEEPAAEGANREQSSATASATPLYMRSLYRCSQLIANYPHSTLSNCALFII